MPCIDPGARRRGARREEPAYWPYVSAEQRRTVGCPARELCEASRFQGTRCRAEFQETSVRQRETMTWERRRSEGTGAVSKLGCDDPTFLLDNLVCLHYGPDSGRTVNVHGTASVRCQAIREEAMTRTYRVGPRVLVATLCLSVCLSTSLLAQRADRAVISGVVTDPQGARAARRDRHDPQPSDRRRHHPHYERRRRVHESAAGPRPVFGDRGHAGIQESRDERDPAPRRRGDPQRRRHAGRRVPGNRAGRRGAAASTSRLPTSPTRSTKNTTGRCRS